MPAEETFSKIMLPEIKTPQLGPKIFCSDIRLMKIISSMKNGYSNKKIIRILLENISEK